MTSDPTILDSPTPDPDEDLALVRDALDPEYEVVEELGRGGMAVVYRAREQALGREVAVKVLPTAMTFDPQLVERFHREARLAAALEHPYIVPIYRVGQVGRVCFFVMKYVKGPSLSDLLARHGRLAPDEVTRMLLQVAEALEHAHAAGVVHRDVKPDNVMRDDTGRYVVMDFGIARSAEAPGLTRTGGSLGTPRYMSPEQARAGEVDGRSDFYSLGVVAYHALAGRPPFDAPDAISLLYRHVNDPVPIPELDSPEAGRVWEAVRLLLSKDPAERPSTRSELEAHLGGGGGATGEGKSSDPAGRGLARATGDDPGHPLLARLRDRGRGFWAAVGAVALMVLFLARSGGAAARCRDAMPEDDPEARAVLVDPVGTIRPGAGSQVAYVVCGVPGDQAFETNLTVRSANDGGLIGGVSRFFSGGDDPVRLTWSDEADGFATARTRSVPLGDLEPGAYRMTIRVEDASGRETESTHDFTVAER